ncbi:putative PLP-dependent enzyme possibly involved in cell wall biogenesis [Candidatus Nitrososphaera evergladensis SR1]|uniref:Putative PLP-dependent enzyme possibly involved in cell wall biogenesis n=1 Tax=Candidatus Nitrososphaera evergladensis SR1 TaxID=1459636 RepID=A0A075MVK1_9ARCH|nr:DegT/DnrJ/EryC1/StrS family aminotransferase [Candidatus Nitrososphaera evergladensis]AIF85193.1 putative PLP-dependent enzyme possibly involved in cell wall biogenesis [Candidatus Nitrososphaera evergladensis SR1]
MIPINKPQLGEEEKREVMSVMEENALTSAASDGGKRVRDFESLMREYLGCKHVVAVNSGTAALHAALLAAEIGPGDEVLVPSFTFVATANAVVASGAKPVFVDVNKQDYTIDVSDAKRKTTKKTKAVIPVHLYGHPCDMDAVSELAQKRSLAVIEDACQSLGSTYKKRQTGTFGQMGCFSMYASKVLTSGEGGAITTDDSDLADKLKMIRNHGMVKGYDTRILGLNMRLPELAAAIAKVQMTKLAAMLAARRKNAELMSELLQGAAAKEVSLPQESDDRVFNWYLYTICFAKGAARDSVMARLQKEGIGATVYYDPPVHKTPYYRKFAARLPATEWCAGRVLSLPVHPGVQDGDVRRTAAEMALALSSPMAS